MTKLYNNKCPGSEPMRNEITIAERINYVLDWASVGATANTWELESGEIGSVQTITAEMRAKLRDYYLNKVFTALTSIWTVGNTPNNYISAGGAVTATILKNAIDYVNKTTPGAKAIFGSRAALTPIMGFAGYWYGTPAGGSGTNWGSETIITEILKTGWLGSYLGVPIVVAPQTYDYPDSHNKMFPEDKLLVIGENVGEFITYGDVKAQEWTENKVVPPQWNTVIYQSFGLLVTNAQGIYVIAVS